MGWLNIISILYLSLVVAGVMGINEHNEVRKILGATLRRWVKLVVGLTVIAIAVQVFSHI